ncbi:MAG: pyridoxal phosphate-dependent aminotransferase [Leptospirales bacterium]|nr:pyridoxal phosphate-dependent aminotransferase [Leptospirales bacterium]
MKYDFDKLNERKGTCSFKWDSLEASYGDASLLPLWVADMDFQSPREVIDAVTERARHGIYGYSFIPDNYYSAAVNWIAKRHGWHIKPEWILHSPKVVTALNMAIQAFSESGDGVIIQQPVYHPFMNSITNNNRKILNNQLVFSESKYTINFDDFEKKASLPNTKIFLLCSPHNPSGRVWTKDELAKMAGICLRHDVIIISDEIHSDLIFTGCRHIPIASILNEIAERTVSCYAPSKTFNLPGLESSFVVISSSELKNKMKQQFMRNSLSANIFGPLAHTAAYTHGEEWLSQVMEYIENNYNFTKSFFENELPSVRVIEPEATYLVWLDFRSYKLSAEALKQKLRKEARVALNEGDVFGSGGEGFARLNIACPRSILESGLKQIKSAFANNA